LLILGWFSDEPEQMNVSVYSNLLCPYITLVLFFIIIIFFDVYGVSKLQVTFFAFLGARLGSTCFFYKFAALTKTLNSEYNRVVFVLLVQDEQ